MSISVHTETITYFIWKCNTCGNTQREERGSTIAVDTGWVLGNGTNDRCPVCVVRDLAFDTDPKAAADTMLEAEAATDEILTDEWFWYLLDGDGNAFGQGAASEMEAASGLLLCYHKEALGQSDVVFAGVVKVDAVLKRSVTPAD